MPHLRYLDMQHAAAIVEPDDLEADAEEVYATLRGGGLALVPIEAGYGLVAIEEPAVRQIYELKGRPATKPCVTVASPAITASVAAPLAPAIVDWIAAITVVSPLAVVTAVASDSVLRASQSAFVRDQTTSNATIALFYAAGRLVEMVAELARRDGRLVVGSSANLSGTGNNYTFADVPEVMVRRVDLALDRGPSGGSGARDRLASTILDLTTGTFLRRGIDYDRIAASWHALRR
jgi:tRNA A37 threonylcarbamoyladenosine synthetase subunit TsaC/SUA5/YrdC